MGKLANCVLIAMAASPFIIKYLSKPDVEWTNKFETDDWFSEDSGVTGRKITYLLVRTSDERKLQMIRLRIAEIIEVIQKPWKTSEFMVESHMISDPIPDNPSKSLVTVRGRDGTALKEVEIVMKETVLPKNYNRVPKYDEDTLIENGIYENVEEELEDLKKAGEMLAQGFF
uniref:KH domain-containing protein n=1 Tax=Caenorhabditis tropicalis TaxID=1561998 RepID=A0A1I7U381_9PELO